MMIDEDVAYVSPATTYRILKLEGLLNTWAVPMKTQKGNGFVQPKKIHQDWHTDIAYVNILGTFFFLITVMEGFSRMILHHELRAHMQEYDVEMVIQRAIEKYPEAKANLISDNGPQYISRDFKEFIRESGLNHVKISVGYPQSNGKLERFHKTIKEEKIRKTAMLNIDDAQNHIDSFIAYYNEERLHSGIYYLTPKEVFDGKMEERIAERQKKLDTARERRARIAESRLSA
jgi:transposase InsO family protein